MIKNPDLGERYVEDKKNSFLRACAEYRSDALRRLRCFHSGPHAYAGAYTYPDTHSDSYAHTYSYTYTYAHPGA